MYDLWQSERLFYRAVEPHDDEFITTMYRDAPTVINAAPFLHTPRSVADSKKYLDYVADCLLGVIICSQEQNTPIGVITLNASGARMQHHRHSELGIKIIPEHQNHGYGTEAIRWALAWGFVQANLHRIEITGFEYNRGALKLYQRLGFKAEGRRRECLWFDGRYWDYMIMGMLKDEWIEGCEKSNLVETNGTE
jgi:RimJ/RimL family protein N-acetyltransferase